MVPSKITIGAVGDNGVGDVEGAKVIDAAAMVGVGICSIARNGRIGDGGGAKVIDAAAKVCRIARDCGIGDGGGTAVVDTAAADAGCSRISRDCGIGDGEDAADTVFDAAAHACGITRDNRIGDGEGARVIKAATIITVICPGNSHAGDREISTSGYVEDIEVTTAAAIITTDGKRGSTWAGDGQGACGGGGGYGRQGL